MKGKKTIKFEEKYIDEMLKYFDIEPNYIKKIESGTKISYEEFASNLPTKKGFCTTAGISSLAFDSWIRDAEDDSYREKDKKGKIKFLEAYRMCQDIQEKIWIENSLKGLYPASFSTFLGKNMFGWKDKTEQTKDYESGEVKKEMQSRLSKKIDNMTESELDSVIVDILG